MEDHLDNFEGVLSTNHHYEDIALRKVGLTPSCSGRGAGHQGFPKLSRRGVLLCAAGMAAAGADRSLAGGFQMPKDKATLSTKQFYEDNPTYIDPLDDTASWVISTPQAQNVDPKLLRAASDSLARMKYACSFIVIRNNSIVYEQYYNGSAENHSNNVHSASKSILGASIGIAVGRGLIPSIDTPISAILPAKYANLMDETKKTITVEHLLTLTSGLKWTEDRTEYRIERADDWIAAILSLPMNSKPGTSFNYSTGDTHLASAVLTEAAKMPTYEFIHQNLLLPMGIKAEHWGRDPQGYFSGGYNFYLTPRKLAKFGVLYLNKGNWRGQQLVPEAWVEASMRAQTDAGAPYNYGYNLWLRNLGAHNVAMAWGFGGQMVYIIEDLNMIVVMTTNTKDFNPDPFNGKHIVESYVIPAAKG
jgi:CubicO group peptidase (beta-lactamase class C family)